MRARKLTWVLIAGCITAITATAVAQGRHRGSQSQGATAQRSRMRLQTQQQLQECDRDQCPRSDVVAGPRNRALSGERLRLGRRHGAPSRGQPCAQNCRRSESDQGRACPNSDSTAAGAPPWAGCRR